MIEVLKQAAENVSKAYDILAFAHTERALEILAKTRTSLRQAIAELESQEPVATVTSETGADITMSWWHEPALPIGTKLYIHPPQRTWVGLTDEDLEPLCNEWRIVFGSWTYEFAKAIEAKLKEKNNEL